MSTARPLRSCPVCGATARPEHRPFCSAACRDRDLIAWATEAYRLPVAPDPLLDAEADAQIVADAGAARPGDAASHATGGAARLDRPPVRDL